MLLASAVSAFCHVKSELSYGAHNHWQERQNMLDGGDLDLYRGNPIFGLTTNELSRCDKHVAQAYKYSVSDGPDRGTRRVLSACNSWP